MPVLSDIEDYISPLIEQQFPEIFRDDGPLLVAFTKAYYEYLEQSTKSLGYSRDLIQYTDPDQLVGDFITHFKKTYLFSIPDESSVDLPFLIKHVLDLYRSKGSKRAVELFFKLVYGKNSDIWIPNEHLFKLSDAEFVTPRYIELYTSDGTALAAFLGNDITGETSGATAYVTSIVETNVQGTLLQILFLENLNGNFIGDELIRDSSNTYRVRLNGSLSDVTFTDAGNNYSVGQELVVKSTANTSTQGVVRVKTIKSGSGIPNVTIQVGGSGYSSNSALSNLQISNTTLQVNNISNTYVNAIYDDANTSHPLETRPANTFQIYEQVYSPRATIGFTSTSNTFVDTVNVTSYVVGINSTGGVVANGRVSSIATTNSTTYTNGSMIVYENTGTFSSSVVKLRFAEDNTVNASFSTFTNSYATGTFIGRRANSIGIIANNIVWPAEPQGFVKGAVSNTYAAVVSNRSGNGTSVSINSVGNTVSTNVYTDFIGDTGSGGVVFADTVIDGSNSNVATLGYGFSKLVLGNIDDVLDKFLTYTTSELLGEISTITITSSGSEYTGDPIILGQNKYVESFHQNDIEILYSNRAGTTPEAGDMLRQYRLDPTQTLTFNTTTANSYTVGEGVVQVVNSTVNNFAQVRSVPNTSTLVLGGIVQKTSGSAVYATGYGATFTANTMTGFLSGHTVNTVTVQSNTTENVTATGKILSSNTSNNSLSIRMHSIEHDFFVSSTTSERLQSNNNTKSFQINNIGGPPNNYNRFVKAGINSNTFANVIVGEGLIDTVSIIDSGLRFKEGEELTFKIGDSTQTINGTANVGGTGIAIGYHKTNSGILGEKYFIPDNDFYQQFSYQVLSEFELNKYKTALKDVVHTAGYKLFGKAQIETYNSKAISMANTSVTQA